MSRFHSYIRTARQLISGYDGSLPFAPVAKAFFAKEKKYGGTDRKQISTLCYHYFRAAKALTKCSEEEKLVAATFLCENKPTKLLEVLKPEWNGLTTLPVKEKIQLLGDNCRQENLFQFARHLSAEIDAPAFALSFLAQPHVFLRLRPGHEKEVKNKLSESAIPFEEIHSHCLALPNGSKIDEIIILDKQAVVQDYSSQQTGAVITEYVLNYLPQITCWDCCAASGGKSLMLHDLRPDASLHVSDVRPSILHNLRQRFRQAGIRNYQSFVADISKPDFQLPGKKLFNLVIADVPCTGSGTWARTPEQCYFFKDSQIEIYAQRQKEIALNVLPYLQPGGYLAYITCSVFTAENEEIVSLLQTKGLQLLHSRYLTGYEIKADTLFITIFKNS